MKPSEPRYLSEPELRLLESQCPSQYLADLHRVAREKWTRPYDTILGMIDKWEACYDENEAYE